MSASVSMTLLRPGAMADLSSVDRVMREAFDPRFGEAWTPSQVAAYTVLPDKSFGAASSFWIGTFGKPLLAAAQVAPPSVDFTTHTL